MSAIWGIVSKENNVIQKKAEDMYDVMQAFHIDRYDRILKGQVYFACGHQYFTKESLGDISPYYDEEKKIWYTGDCYLYNRCEVVKLIAQREGKKTLQEYESMGDAFLSYRLYLHFGENFVSYLRGSFAMAIYDEKNMELFLYTDQLSRRYLAYYYDDDGICFASVYQPILSYLGKEKTALQDEWIMAAYTDCSADTLKFPDKTVWKNVFQTEPGKYVKINLKTQKRESITYWNPLETIREQKHKDDMLYKESFLKVFKDTVAQMLRGKDKTGIMLSGGLDSSAVAAMTAPILHQRGENLYSYTAIPLKDYPCRNDKYFAENEKEMIYLQKKMYPNIIPKFVDANGKNCFTRMEDYAQFFMEPVKPVLNMINVEEMFSSAAKDNCSILLSGQNGNATISYGNLLTYIHQKNVKGHFLQAYREVKAFGKRRKIGRKRILSVYFKTLSEQKTGGEKFGNDCLLRQEDIKKYHLDSLEKNIRKNRGYGLLDNKKQQKNFCFMPLLYSHMGFYDTYNSLKYGVLPLDPTLTKEMIELCFSMPIDCYVKGGKERRAVRDYMKGMVPEEILENHTMRGIQAADFAYRVNHDWDKIKDQVYDILNEPLLNQYLSVEKRNALIEEVEKKEYSMDKNLVARVAVISSLGYFLRTALKKA